MGISLFFVSNSRRNNCNNNAKILTHGWLVFEDLNEDEKVSSGESILLVSNRPDQSITLSSDIPKVKFSSEGTAIGYANTFTFCDARGDSAKKGLKLSSSGSAQSAEANDIKRACP